MTDTANQPSATDERPPSTWGKVFVLIAVVLFIAFWTWALFFASKEAVNKIDDRAWAARAEQICVSAQQDVFALSVPVTIQPDDSAAVRERADIVDTSTDIIEAMLDDVVAVKPTDDKGQAIVPLWEADYRQYIQDRRNYADILRTGGVMIEFAVTPVSNIPIEERLATFAGDNEMTSCAPLHDLTR